MSKAVYHLVDDIDDDSTRSLSEFLLNARTDPKCEIELFITSAGGDPSCAFALYDLIRSIPNKVTTVAAGNADSAATIIFLAGNKRAIMPNATILMHTPRVELGADRKLSFQEIKRLYLRQRTLFSKLLKIFVSRTKQKKATIKRLCYKLKVLSAKEVVKYGFAHKMGYLPKEK